MITVTSSKHRSITLVLRLKAEITNEAAALVNGEGLGEANKGL